MLMTSAFVREYCRRPYGLRNRRQFFLRRIKNVFAQYRAHVRLRIAVFCRIGKDIPKATVQAAIGGVPLAMGLSCGDTVLAVAVVAILFTAPLGAFAIDLIVKKTSLFKKGKTSESDTGTGCESSEKIKETYNEVLPDCDNDSYKDMEKNVNK